MPTTPYTRLHFVRIWMGSPYKKNPACHMRHIDAHMAIALTTAEYVSRHRSELSCNVVFLFQPGEEGAAGAKKMIACGALENPM